MASHSIDMRWHRRKSRERKLPFEIRNSKLYHEKILTGNFLDEDGFVSLLILQSKLSTQNYPTMCPWHKINGNENIRLIIQRRTFIVLSNCNKEKHSVRTYSMKSCWKGIDHTFSLILCSRIGNLSSP